MDGRRFIIAMFSSVKAHSITQVVMNLPNDAAEYLGVLYFPLPFPTFCSGKQISRFLKLNLAATAIQYAIS